MSYIENPKTKGSGIVTCIPQTGLCPMKCEDCFFQSGRSYLEPLANNLPNIPPESPYNVVRVNDGNDSNVDRESVVETARRFPMRFYNTSIPHDLRGFDAPVVLTLNAGKRTDSHVHLLPEIPKNLMFVRVRTNTWNLGLVDSAVEHYTKSDIAVVLTFMAYYEESSIPADRRQNYTFRKRTLNSYYAITTDAWRGVMKRYEDNIRVYSCGKIEGERGKTACKYCGNCLREYFAAVEKSWTK